MACCCPGRDEGWPAPGSARCFLRLLVVDILPDVVGDLVASLLGQLGVVVEIESGSKAPLRNLEKTIDVPGAQQLGIGIHIDGKSTNPTRTRDEGSWG